MNHAVCHPQSIKGLDQVIDLKVDTASTTIDHRINNTMNHEQVVLYVAFLPGPYIGIRHVGIKKWIFLWID
jgi:hypothetical protein